LKQSKQISIAQIGILLLMPILCSNLQAEYNQNQYRQYYNQQNQYRQNQYRQNQYRQNQYRQNQYTQSRNPQSQSPYMQNQRGAVGYGQARGYRQQNEELDELPQLSKEEQREENKHAEEQRQIYLGAVGYGQARGYRQQNEDFDELPQLSKEERREENKNAEEQRETYLGEEEEEIAENKSTVNQREEEKSAEGQNIEETEIATWRKMYILPELQLINPEEYKSSPGTSSNTPTAFGLKWGLASAGLSYQSSTREGSAPDAGISMGLGYGNPTKFVGIEGIISITDVLVTTGRAGGFGAKVHRRFGERTSIALGFENILEWGTVGNGGMNSYLVGTHTYLLKESPKDYFSTVTVTVGLGTGRFQLSKNNIAAGSSGFGAFASVGIKIARPLSLFVEWSGPDANVGASIVPFRDLPIVATISLADILSISRVTANISFGIDYL